MPPAGPRFVPHVILAVVTFAMTVPTVALAQYRPRSSYSTETIPTVEPIISGLGAGITTLVVGGLLVLLAPQYTEQVTDQAMETPGIAFLWGIGASILVIAVAFGLAITVIGIVIALPLLLAFGLFAFVTTEFGFLSAGRLASDDWTVVLLVAVLVAVFSGFVPILGGLVGFVLGSIGIGATIVDYRAD